MHELHGPDNCGMYCQLRYDIRDIMHRWTSSFNNGKHGPENCGEKCVTQSDAESDICEICDIGDIYEKAVSSVPGVPGVPCVPGVSGVPHGSENSRVKCVTQRNAGRPGDRASDIWHSDMCTSPPGLGGFQFVYMYMDAPW